MPKNTLLSISLVLMVLFSFGQHSISTNEQKLMTDNVQSVVNNYYAMLANIGSTNNSFDERRLFIEDIITTYFHNENIRVCNDLYTGGVPDYLVRDYLGTIMSTYPLAQGVIFKHTIQEVNGPYKGQSGFAFYLVRVVRHLRGINNAGVMQDATMTLDFYLRFDRIGDKWNYTPKIYDIRKAESGVEGRFTKWKEKDIPTVPAKSTPETPKETTTLQGFYEKIESKPIATNTSSLPAPIQKLINDMVFVKGGGFTMGCNSKNTNNCYSNEFPNAFIHLSNYYISKFEITNAQYVAFLNAQSNISEILPLWINLDGKMNGENCRINFSQNSFSVDIKYANHPVTYVSWYGAKAFCDWLSKESGFNFRLPTEAEWEFAARSRGQDFTYPWGNSNPSISKGDNIADESAKILFTSWEIWNGYNDGFSQIAPVGSLGYNDLGIADMGGNVREWCNDWYGDYDIDIKTNPTGSRSGTKRVVRGGSWDSKPSTIRTTYRFHYLPNRQDNFIGFRVVRF